MTPLPTRFISDILFLLLSSSLWRMKLAARSALIHPSYHPTRNKISSSPPNNLLRLRPNGISHSSSCSALIVWGSPRYIFLLLPSLSIFTILYPLVIVWLIVQSNLFPRTCLTRKAVDHGSKLSLGAAVLHSSSHDHALHQSLILDPPRRSPLGSPVIQAQSRALTRSPG